MAEHVPRWPYFPRRRPGSHLKSLWNWEQSLLAVVLSQHDVDWVYLPPSSSPTRFRGKRSPSGAILTPSSPGYNVSAMANINLRLVYRPAAITYPKTPQDVQKYVKCGAKYGVAVVARSGGHSYASYGAGGQDGSLVIDVANMTAATVAASGKAKIQTGNRLGDIAQKLWDNGQRVLPHGVCPYVGLGGHAAFGGFGPFSRVAGLLHDHITEAEVVLADGTLTTASLTKNSDLFWALRGAGASYGIVTQWTFATLAAPPSVISYTIEYAGAGLKPGEFLELFKKWQKIAIAAPNQLSVICTVSTSLTPETDLLSLQFRGTYYGTQAAFDKLTSGWGTLLAPGNFTSRAHNWYDGLVALSGPLSTSAPEAPWTFFTKSLFTKAAVTDAQWASLVDYMSGEGTTSGNLWYIEIDRYGGGVAAQPKDATSFAQRDAVLSFQLSTVALTPPLPAGGIPFLNNMLKSLEPNPQAAYVNYVDPTLTPAEWKQQYYGTHYPRLSSIKRAVDPHNVFRFPQSIGLS
ncbi:FAD-binding domain-containing protein [Ceratobasidium sp. AG-I]|nr:FAD-binding domain-containing protein [Ceratobasidium sp. AG-I]